MSEEKKYVVYRGSVFPRMVTPDDLWIMSEAEWESYEIDPPKNATLLARGLTREVATKMIQLTEEKQT